MHEDESHDLDVPRFVADCVQTNAEAIVVSAGGVYAFYPSQVPHHYVSPVVEGRDLLGEIVAAARTKGLKVIARVDFSRAREDAWQAHPEWFQRDAEGQVMRAGVYYRTCPLGGYQNEAVALPVLREILGRYEVDGFHLNASGYGGHCYCAVCTAAYGGPLPRDAQTDPQGWRRFLRWREETLGHQMAGYYQAITELKPDALFMAELAGPDSPEWARSAAHHLPSLSRSFSHLLMTAGGLASARTSRWWVGMAVDQARAVRRKRSPVINIKAQMRDLNLPQAIMPPAEYAFACYQALAHGAGLIASTFGFPGHQADPRTMPAITEILGLMRQQQDVLDRSEPVQPPGPGLARARLLKGKALEGKATEGLRGEFVGLYGALKARHVLTSVLFDEEITLKRLSRYEVVILPGAAWLADEQTAALIAYMRQGGRLVLLDSPTEQGGRGFPLLPQALTELIGGSGAMSRAWPVTC